MPALGGNDRMMKYQYGFMGKFLHFPWKTYFVHTRFFRFLPLGYLAACYLAFGPINKFVNSPGNAEKWAATRAKYHYDTFAPLKDPYGEL